MTEFLAHYSEYFSNVISLETYQQRIRRQTDGMKQVVTVNYVCIPILLCSHVTILATSDVGLLQVGPKK